MKGDQIKLKGESAKVVAEVKVMNGGRNPTVQICELDKTGIFVVTCNGFLRGQSATKEVALVYFFATIQDEA